MPYEVIYVVNFHGGLNPTVNSHHWPPMQVSPTTPTNQGEFIQDPDGGSILKATRLSSSAAPAVYSVFLTPPDVPVGSRFRIRVWFDRPQGEGFDANGVLVPINDIGTTALTQPERWAVSLAVGPSNNLNDLNATINLTCQIRNLLPGKPGGSVGLNAPGSLEGTGSVIPMMSVPRYPEMRYGVFKLEHVFNGTSAGSPGHLYSIGRGHLKYDFPVHYPPAGTRPFVETASAYSSGVFQNAAAVRALGVTLVTQGGIGRISVRLRGFEVSLLN